MVINTNMIGKAISTQSEAFSSTQRISGPTLKNNATKQNRDSFSSNVFTFPESSGVYEKDIGKKSLANQINYSVQSVLNAEKASITSKIRKFENDEDKFMMAKTAYYTMQSTISSAREANKNAIEEFNALEEEKAYYQNVLTDKNNVYQSNGQYLLKGNRRGEIISRDDVDSALKDVQERIDKVIKTDTGTDAIKSIISDTYSYSASVFAAATGKSSSAYNITENDSLFGVWDRTEENFLEEANKAIDELDSRSEALSEIFADYKAELEAEGIDTTISVPTLEVQSVLDEYSTTLDFINSQFDGDAARMANQEKLLKYIPDKYSYLLEE